MNKKNHIKDKGFTLIEMLAVFSLMAIVSGVGFASLLAYSRAQTLTQAASDIKQAVQQARFNALSNVKPAACSGLLASYTISFCQNNNPSCNGSGISNNGGYIITSSCGSATYTTSTSKLPANVTFGAIANPCQNIQFQASSATAYNDGTGNVCAIELDAYGKNLQMSISSQGFVSP